MGEEALSELNSIWDEARCFIERGDFDKAIEIYKYVLVRYADNAVAVEYGNAYLGDTFLTIQRLDLAEEHIKKAINLKPENPGYRYILGFVYSYKRQWDKAIPEFEIAVARESDNGEYLRGLGWALYESGDAARGLVFLEKASRLAPDNANILTDLAVACLSSVKIDKAKEYAERAVRTDPANPVAQDVLKRIMGFSKGFSQLDKKVAKTRTKPLNIYLLAKEHHND